MLSSALTGGSLTGRASWSGLAWFPSLPGLGCSGFVLFLCSGPSSGLVFTLKTLSEFLLLRILNEYCRHSVRVVASGGGRIQTSPSPSRPPVSPCCGVLPCAWAALPSTRYPRGASRQTSEASLLRSTLLSRAQTCQLCWSPVVAFSDREACRAPLGLRPPE